MGDPVIGEESVEFLAAFFATEPIMHNFGKPVTEMEYFYIPSAVSREGRSAPPAAV
jgi:hypothetical protein